MISSSSSLALLRLLGLLGPLFAADMLGRRGELWGGQYAWKSLWQDFPGDVPHVFPVLRQR